MDNRLAERARSGDLNALAELLKENYSFLYRYLLKITLNPDKAADYTQETMLRSVEKIRLFDGKAKFSTWLITIATRLVIDAERRKGRERRFLLRHAQEEEQTGRLLKWRLEAAGAEWLDVLDALSTMGADSRLAVVLKHYYGYSQQEIAAMTGVPEGTVKSRIHHGLIWLRKELTEHEEKTDQPV
ncbi:RNA polymerase sigma factor SigY [Gorillibacterium timonense]|uniref:RNA polymerase sigma factor SigY n=1 Tax=Gorillibacterium timonense TaxID=1689269 RepID=UPI00071E15B8|nr:RNA polymerase sigma factor SigY [Gorillibacterium timonense]